MSGTALPCVVCGVVLPNAFEESENQPLDGTYLMTRGSYGSTAFDPMDDAYLELSICDECLVKAGAQGRVAMSREKRPVVVRLEPGKPHRETIAGWERVWYPLVPWTKDTPGYSEDDVLLVTEEELGATLVDERTGYPRVEWEHWVAAHRLRSGAVAQAADS